MCRTHPRLCAQTARRVHLVINRVPQKAFRVLEERAAQVRSCRGEVQRADGMAEDGVLLVQRCVGLVVPVHVRREQEAA